MSGRRLNKKKSLAFLIREPHCLDMQIEQLATVGMSEAFNPADAPDETAWREAMEQPPKGWNEIEAGLDEATR
jgi:hypothetical protein